MKDKIEQFLNALKSILEKKSEKPALKRDLEDPEKLAEFVSHSIGSDTQRIHLGGPTKEA